MVGLARFGLTKGVAKVLVFRWMGGGCLDPEDLDGEREGNSMVSWRLKSTLRLAGERGLSVGPSSPGARAGGDFPILAGASRLEGVDGALEVVVVLAGLGASLVLAEELGRG